MENAGRHTFVDEIDDLLPQTQCRRCGHDGCRPYAEAVAAGAPINRCPPGGEIAISALAQLTGRAVVPLDPGLGVGSTSVRAEIDESVCIGCTLCIEACPVDAIIGGPKRMHTVINALCTGCELCIAPCPVDCITLVPAQRRWSKVDAHAARQRHDAVRARITSHQRPAVLEPRHEPGNVAEPVTSRILSPDERGHAVTAALQRARARRLTAG